MRHAYSALAWTCITFLPAVATAQPTVPSQTEIAAELQRLKMELETARAELQRLRADVDQLKRPETADPQAAPVPLGPVVEMLQTQVAEHAQTKVESGSRLPLKIFGTIHSSTAANTGEANWLENPNIVAPPPAPTGPTGSFTSTMRQTRLGVSAEGLTLGNWQASGSLVVDFFGGIPAFQTGQVMGLPRLLYAFTRFERDGTAIEVGQDEMMLAPRNPTSVAALSFPLLFRAGNLYLRVPQARVERRLSGSTTSELRGMVGLVAPVGGDFRSPDYTFVPPALGGERSRWPAVQARIGWQRGDEQRGASVGASGHYGRERPADRLVTSWAAAVDFHAQGARVGVAGEAFTGDNLDAFGGALGQPVRATGGFAEVRFNPVNRWQLVFGGGIDRPDAVAPLLRNKTVYGNLTFHPTPEIAASLEYRWLETSAAAAKRRNNHVNWVLTYSF